MNSGIQAFRHSGIQAFRHELRTLVFLTFLLNFTVISVFSQQRTKSVQTNFQCDIVLDIYDAFYDWQTSTSWGGNGIPKSEAEKFSVGAVCLANLNDTNGNGVPDYQETNITQNHLGRNEVDLMKLVIRPRDAGLNLSGNVTLRQISGNSIKLWSSPVKLSGTEVSLPMTVDAIDLPMTLYVEALEPSSTARDIVLEADFAGKTDKVSATAVWVGIEKIYHKNDDQIDMQLLSEFGCVESLLNFNYDDDDNTYFGLGRPVSVVQFQGHPNNQTVIQQKARILFQWQLVPANAYNLIRIDGTRQRHTNNWRLDLDLTSGPDCKFNHTTTPFPFNKTPIPENNELPNDDSSTGCIDEITNDGVFLTWDAPGIVINQEFLEGDSFPRFLGYGNDKTNFLEWVRLAPSYTPRIYFNPPGVRVEN